MISYRFHGYALVLPLLAGCGKVISSIHGPITGISRPIYRASWKRLCKEGEWAVYRKQTVKATG